MERARPGLVDALSLLSEVADELVLRTVQDTHVAVLDRVHGRRGHLARGVPGTVERAHRGIAGGVYAGVGLGLRGASRALGGLAGRHPGPPLEARPGGRFVSGAVNGLIGDRLVRERPRLAITLAVRHEGRDVLPDADGLEAAFPAASGRVAVFLHGLCENESHWERGREQRGTTYPEELADLGWTPVRLRANTGLSLRENGVALSSLLQRLVEAWPVPVDRIALVGHSLGGLVLRAAGAVSTEEDHPWTSRVSDVVTLGTPHLGAPLARSVATGSGWLARVPESAAFGRILDWRSVGIHDLVEGLAEDVPALPEARYHLVSGTLAGSARHPVGAWIGDGLVRPPSAHGRGGGRSLFPGAEVLHVPKAGHFDLLNHPTVAEALRGWLG